MSKGKPQYNFRRCPLGHKLPHKLGAGECTPVRCGAADGPAKKTLTKQLRDAQAGATAAVGDPPSDTSVASPAPAQAASQAVSDDFSDAASAAATPSPEETRALVKKEEELLAREHQRDKLAVKRHEKWNKFLAVPQNLTGEEAEKWADHKLASLLPQAVATLERMAKYGTEDQQERAAKQILEANGRGKRDAATASTPPIVIQVTGGVSLPWRQEKTVEGQATAVKPSDT